MLPDDKIIALYCIVIVQRYASLRRCHIEDRKWLQQPLSPCCILVSPENIGHFMKLRGHVNSACRVPGSRRAATGWLDFNGAVLWFGKTVKRHMAGDTYRPTPSGGCANICISQFQEVARWGVPRQTCCQRRYFMGYGTGPTWTVSGEVCLRREVNMTAASE